ncbi:hypothetical protein [Streptosporangium sp. NPDC048865]|uniref:hypothetical protein n=1 Tax=Streptosporangium sp. NPDC048865 TaxID=3155766 RepID=UPI003426962F
MSTRRRGINRDAVVRRYNDGESIRQIAATLEFSHAAVYRALKGRVTFRPVGGVTGTRAPEERKQEILAAYRAGVPVQEIMATYHAGDITIRAIAAEAGESKRPKGPRRRLDWEQIGQLWDRGWPPDAIAILVGGNQGHVRRILQKVRPPEGEPEECEDEPAPAG